MDRWAHLGHTLGECWNDKDKSITFVHIPKNASSFIKGCLLGTKKFTHSNSLITADKYLITLRDPVERWISGITQFMTVPTNQHLTLRDLVDTVTVDDHTELQTYFLEGIDLDCCSFLWVDRNLRNNVKQWAIDNGYQIDVDSVPDINKGDQLAKDRFAAMVDGNSQIKLKLAERYANDYELINRVKFYGN
jgi:hypothetical protein